MKVRQGFVSNSSSSSFIIAFPKGKTNKEIEKRIIEALKIPEDSPLYWLSKDVADVFIGYRDIDLEYYEKGDNKYDTVKRLEKLGFEVYEGSVSNDSGNMVEDLLYNTRLVIDEPDLYLDNSGEC